MNTTADRDSLHRIVVLNPKGGSGKTTLATNLASFFALRGPPPTLVDCDPQGYCTRWLDKRSGDQPKIHGVAANVENVNETAEAASNTWHDSEQVIVDLPAAVPPDQLFDQTYGAHSILIPVMPSEIDVYAASRLIAELLLITQLDRRERKLAVVANRTRQNTKSYRMLMRFLRSLAIPMIAQLRDSQNFVHAAAAGLGIYEMPAYKVRRDIEQMEPIVAWLDQWRMRRLDAAASPGYEHRSGAEVLTPAIVGSKLS